MLDGLERKKSAQIRMIDVLPHIIAFLPTGAIVLLRLAGPFGREATLSPLRCGPAETSLSRRSPHATHPCTRPATATQRRDSGSPHGLRPMPHPCRNLRLNCRASRSHHARHFGIERAGRRERSDYHYEAIRNAGSRGHSGGSLCLSARWDGENRASISISVKYCLFVMRADNRGEGGILALMSLIGANSFAPGVKILTGMGLLGAALVYGDDNDQGPDDER